MAILIGVSRNLDFLKDQPGQENYWCVGGATSSAKPGDQLLLYIPASMNARRSGIAQVYEITSAPHQPAQSRCYQYGMVQVQTKLLFNLKVHVKARDMKENPDLQSWGALLRNFQGVTFSVREEVWSTLRAMIVGANPEADKILHPAAS